VSCTCLTYRCRCLIRVWELPQRLRWSRTLHIIGINGFDDVVVRLPGQHGTVGQMHCSRTDSLVALKDYKAAKQSLTKALELNPKNSDGMLALAAAQYSTGSLVRSTKRSHHTSELSNSPREMYAPTYCLPHSQIPMADGKRPSNTTKRCSTFSPIIQ
jgi:hypothetical protein